MKQNILNEAANIIKVQKHQLNRTVDKTQEMNEISAEILNEQKCNDEILDELLNTMENLLQERDLTVQPDEEEILAIENNIEIHNTTDNRKIAFIDFVEIDENISWQDYLSKIEEYSKIHNIDISKDPFTDIMTTTERMEFYKKINEEFTYKNAKCDKYDYLIAGTCGLIGGLIDILFVGAPGNSDLGNYVDKNADKITENFAEFLGWDKNKALQKGRNTTASAIGFLENKFKVNYDQATTSATDGMIDNLTLKNHHLKNLAHSPDIIGLFFSILNQFTNTSTFLSNGKLISIDTETFELQGNNFISKCFCGFANWFGHIISDWTGSSGTVGQGNRGTGIPIPFYNLFQTIDVGHFGKKDRQTFAMITSEVFEKGYDFRFGMTMAIPVLLTELLIRFMFVMKNRFYHKKDWNKCIPKITIPELRRMLLVGHGTLCLLDGADAFIRSGGELVTFLSRTNLIAWVRFGSLALKEVTAWYNEDHLDLDKVDKYIEEEYNRLLKQM